MEPSPAKYPHNEKILFDILASGAQKCPDTRSAIVRVERIQPRRTMYVDLQQFCFRSLLIWTRAMNKIVFARCVRWPRTRRTPVSSTRSLARIRRNVDRCLSRRHRRRWSLRSRPRLNHGRCGNSIGTPAGTVGQRRRWHSSASE